MKALLLAAGFGTRLKPFTFLQSKASLPVLNVPMIHYPLQYLSTNKISETIINLHAHPDSVTHAAGNHFGEMGILYSHEPQILGTAGAMAKAFPFLGDELFVVMNSDMICDVPLEAVVEHHTKSGNLVTLVVMNAGQIQGYSSLYFDVETMKLNGIREGNGLQCHYTGLQVVDPKVIQNIPEDRKTEIFVDLYPELMKGQHIGGFLYDGLWLEMGTLAEYWNTSMRLLNTPLPTELRPTGMLSTLISPKASVEPADKIFDTIVMDYAIIKETAKLEHCIVGMNTEISRDYRNAALLRGFLPWYF